jgi:hypothetical protein
MHRTIPEASRRWWEIIATGLFEQHLWPRFSPEAGANPLEPSGREIVGKKEG